MFCFTDKLEQKLFSLAFPFKVKTMIPLSYQETVFFYNFIPITFDLLDSKYMFGRLNIVFMIQS